MHAYDNPAKNFPKPITSPSLSDACRLALQTNALISW
jgi:hypothetical protein